MCEVEAEVDSSAKGWEGAGERGGGLGGVGEPLGAGVAERERKKGGKEKGRGRRVDGKVK